MADDSDVPAAVDSRRARCHRHDRDDVQRPRELEKLAHVLTGASDAVDLACLLVTVSPEQAASDSDLAGPVLGIHHEYSRRTDRHVVDVGSLPARPPNVMEDVEAVWAEQLELLADSLFACPATVPLVGVAFGSFGALEKFLCLGTQEFRLSAQALRLLPR
jgi:hypothetical protein